MSRSAAARRFLFASCAVAVAALAATPAHAAEGSRACALATASELEPVLGRVSLKAAAPMTGTQTEICRGQAPNATVLLRLATGLDPGRDRSGARESAGIALFEKMGAKVDVKRFGPITCSFVEPPASQPQLGFNTTCTLAKDTSVAGIEVTAQSRKDAVSIDQLRPLVEKMADRF